MQKFTVHTISLFLMLINIAVASAQSDTSSYKFDEFAALFLKNKIEPSTSSEELMKINLLSRPQIDCEMYNWFIIRGQAEKAKRCSIHYVENRYGVNINIDYEMLNNGILKEQSVSKTGTYEIVDKDGYVNVREKPDINSKVLYTLKSGSVIIGHTENGSKWDEVLRVLDDEVVKEDLNKKGGYIHSSRLSNYW